MVVFMNESSVNTSHRIKTEQDERMRGKAMYPHIYTVLNIKMYCKPVLCNTVLISAVTTLNFCKGFHIR